MIKASFFESHASSDAEGAEWVSDWRRVWLVFNHAEILESAQRMANPECSAAATSKKATLKNRTMPA
jgi:hypothetical protein